jgi:16S rRNA processing protein RimM
VALVLIGRITTSFGLKGHVKIDLAGRSPEQAEELESVLVGRDPETPASMVEKRVEDVRVSHNGVFVKLEGVDDRNAADAMRGWMLFLDESEMAAPRAGSYLVHDIEGCEVFDAAGTRIGRIEEVLKLPGHDLWVVRDGTRVVNLPAVKAHVIEVDIAKKRVTIASAEGLDGA